MKSITAKTAMNLTDMGWVFLISQYLLATGIEGRAHELRSVNMLQCGTIH
jgi:hypothetical protein